MKHSHLAALLLTGGLLAGCSDSLQSPDEMKSNEYVKQFIEDFGIPAEGHDFSMATSAGLQVKASKPTRIIVTSEIDGDEYEFANLSVPAGTSPLPVTIPSTVEKLNIYLGLDKYTVGVNETIDLDRLAESAPSRGYEFSSDATFKVTGTGNPVIAIKYSDFLEDYFNAFPLDKDNTITYKTGTTNKLTQSAVLTETINGHTFYFCETILTDAVSSKEDIEYDIFPIYWRQTNNCKNYSMRLSKFQHFETTQDVDFGSTNPTIPFPKLGYSTTISSVDAVNFNDLSGFTYDDGTSTEAYAIGNPDMVIVSEGIRISVPYNEGVEGFAMDLVMHTAGGDLVSSSSPYNNMRIWGDNVYYRTSISHLAACRGASKRTYLDKMYLRTDVKGGNQNIDSRKYDPLTIHNPDGTTEKRDAIVLPFLLGFTTPPSKAEDDDVLRNYANALFLVVPVTRKGDGTNEYCLGNIRQFTSKFKKYYWVVAAEDLGGSCDWDFNDAVFAFTDEIQDLNTVNTGSERTILWGPPGAVPVRRINVMPLAAGGTLPIYITFTGKVFKMADINIPGTGNMTFTEANEALRKKLQNADVQDGTWVLGTELHRWLELESYTQIYNTGENRISFNTGNKNCQITVPTDIRPADYATNKFPVNSQMSTDNQPLLGFGVLVDREDKLQIYAPNEYKNGYYMEALPEYELGKDTYLIGRPDFSKGKLAPQMIVVPAGYYDNNDGGYYDLEGEKFTDGTNLSAWKVSWEWPRENVSIKDAYPDFLEWLKNPNFDWTKNVDRSKVTQK